MMVHRMNGRMDLINGGQIKSVVDRKKRLRC